MVLPPFFLGLGVDFDDFMDILSFSKIYFSRFGLLWSETMTTDWKLRQALSLHNRARLYVWSTVFGAFSALMMVSALKLAWTHAEPFSVERWTFLFSAMTMLLSGQLGVQHAKIEAENQTFWGKIKWERRFLLDYLRQERRELLPVGVVAIAWVLEEYDRGAWPDMFKEQMLLCCLAHFGDDAMEPLLEQAIGFYACLALFEKDKLSAKQTRQEREEALNKTLRALQNRDVLKECLRNFCLLADG